ncbi:MAG TPA: ClpXP protease specificity-enhancing factor [Rhodocyclaceae bacterium]|nr:ClpXP protease specificity-enhancing factor [Rhodocyclaceae bacterium]
MEDFQESFKPYLVRALHEWCVDQGYTPYLGVAVDEDTRVPHEFVKDGRIVLNVSPDATNHLFIGNEKITFHARFSGKVFPVTVPISQVTGLHAAETGLGQDFEIRGNAGLHSVPKTHATGPTAVPAPGPAPGSSSSRPSGKPTLTRVK